MDDGIPHIVASINRACRACVVRTGGFGYGKERRDRTIGQGSLDSAAIFQRIGLHVPPSAKIEYSQYQPGQDDNARVILLMPAADWDAMRAKPPLNAMPYDLYTADEAMRLGADRGAWRPAAEPEIKGAQLQLPNAEAVNVGVAPAGGGRVRVYLFWFQT